MKKKQEWLNRSLLDSPYCYTLCLSEKAFNRELKRLKVPKKNRGNWIKTPQADATLHFLEQNSGVGLSAIVCLRPGDGIGTGQVYGLIIHEAVHLWQAIKDHIGEHTPGAEEEAYAIQRIAQSLIYSYHEQTLGERREF